MTTLTEKNIKAPEVRKKLNCWEHKKCGRQPGGHMVHELHICPATTDQKLNGIHGGINAGRACWAVAGSLSGKKIQGIYAKKLMNCWCCEFMNFVKLEEESTEMGFSQGRLGMERALAKRDSEKIRSSLKPCEPEHTRS